MKLPKGMTPEQLIADMRSKGADIVDHGVAKAAFHAADSERQDKANKKKSMPTLKNPIRTALRVEFTLWLPILVVSEANRRDHWAVKNKRKKAQQQAIRIALMGCFLPKLMRIETGSVLFTRLSDGNKKLDGDNLANAFKAPRDQVADWIGIDDGDSRMTWSYDQDKSLSNGVVINVVLNMAMETLP